ncbi:MAG: LamG-like jellyroll fold domain-containing protein [Planctomycetaceae bacterium]
MKLSLSAVCFSLCVLNLSVSVHAQPSVAPWWEPYTAGDINGPEVLGFWKFDGDADGLLRDSSSHQHTATLRGATWNSAGRIGGCLQSGAGWPVVDQSHSIHVASSPVLSPNSAFTVEMWIHPDNTDNFPDNVQPVLMDSKYVASNHTGFLWSLPKAVGDGNRQLAIEIGMGTSSEKWYSRAFPLQHGVWQHVAASYDALGTVTFFVNGEDIGQVTKPNCGPMARSTRTLAIGDRIGSLYNGFPGRIDEVRLTIGQRDFRPIRFDSTAARRVVMRMSDHEVLTGRLINQTGKPLKNVSVTAELAGITQKLPITELPTNPQSVEFPIDTTLKSGEYHVTLNVTLAEFQGSDSAYQTRLRIPVIIKSRPLPHRLPVIMWGIGGTEGVVKEVSRLKDIGFTHCLGLRVDFQKIWNDGADALPGTDADIQDGLNMLDVALENDIRIVAALSPGSWLRHAEAGKPFLRIDRSGNHYGREDISGVFPQVQDFCFHVGSAVSKAWGHHPALDAALLHTEVRGESQVSFHPIEIDRYKQATGHDIPDEVTIKNGVEYGKLPNFPKDRVIADDDPILNYLTWFWKTGDGWNNLNTRLNDGLKKNAKPDFWTFYDPAVRVPSISGSGGHVDVLAHWTYSYPDPVRIGLCTDELLEMARAGGRGQDVMKMTQLIWYRSQTAPINATAAGEQSPWVDQDPDAAYITIAPMHLREAFWWKLSRPIKGIMYHGWQSLVETDSTGAYRYTNPNTKFELQRLIRDVVVPLGPTLLQVPDAPADVVFLESFTSQMFARRGTYGWNHTWAGDLYHVLMYAGLQPRVMYEESLLKGDLAGATILVMPDCDVLTKSAVKAIQKFQADGGLVIADAELCPAVKPDHVINRFSRTSKADDDRTALLTAAENLRTWLETRYTRTLDSSNADVVSRLRRFNSTDYVFAVNDRREFGQYLGGYGKVMEDGLPSETTLVLNRKDGHVYDLVAGREVPASTADGKLSLPVKLGPCEGRIFMVTGKPITDVTVNAPEAAQPGQKIEVTIRITDGTDPLDAVIPLLVEITDPEGRESEFSGHYGAAGGELTIHTDFASNDRLGLWQFRATELASGTSAAAYVRLSKSPSGSD